MLIIIHGSTYALIIKNIKWLNTILLSIKDEYHESQTSFPLDDEFKVLADEFNQIQDRKQESSHMLKEHGERDI